MAGPTAIAVAASIATGMAIAEPVADTGTAGATIFAIAIAEPGAAGADITAAAIAGRAAAVRLGR
jgi:hypothetical protein